MTDITPLPLEVFAQAIASQHDARKDEDEEAAAINAGTQVVLFGDNGVDLGYDDTDLLHVWFHFDGVEPGDCVEMVFGTLYHEDQTTIALIAETIVRQFQ